MILDIGAGTGALVAYASEVDHGAEIEIRRAGQTWDGLHTAVRARHMASGVRYAGVFGSLPAGRYHLRFRDRPAFDEAASVDVRPGVVTETSLRP